MFDGWYAQINDKVRLIYFFLATNKNLNKGRT